MGIQRNPWKSMEIHGNHLKFFEIHRNPSKSNEIIEILPKSIEIHKKSIAEKIESSEQLKSDYMLIPFKDQISSDQSNINRFSRVAQQPHKQHATCFEIKRSAAAAVALQ